MRTQRYESDLIRIYKYTLMRFGVRVAQETKRQLIEVEKRLAEGTANIQSDPEFHSGRFRYVSIRNSQKIFFDSDDDHIYMLTAGYDRRNWKELLKDLDAYADAQMAILKGD